MLSFSAKTKHELCRVQVTRPCCRTAELYGMLLFAPVFSHREIKLVSEQNAIIRRAAVLLHTVCGVYAEPTASGRRWMLRLTEEDDLRAVLGRMGYDFKSHITYHLNRNILDHDCCPAAFLRGVFLMSGSLSSPEKKCHLEIKTGHAILCREVMSLMLDIGLAPKVTERPTAWLLYWKDSGRVEDFLTMLGATRAAMALMEAKVEKQLRNEVNRQVNCETANLLKVTGASTRQIAAIEKALVVAGLEVFPENLRETVDLRVAHPSASLAELAAMFDPPISKPGLNHRLSRIMEIAERVTQTEL